MIEGLGKFGAILAARDDNPPTPEPLPLTASFFVHYNEKSLKIQSLSTLSEPLPGNKVIGIDDEFALKFLNGQESLSMYSVVAFKDEKFELHKTISVAEVFSVRVDVVPVIYEIEEHPLPSVTIEVDEEENFVSVHYNGDEIKKLTTPIKIYFTRFDDPSFLKCAFSLDVNILNKILEKNSLTEWPNPIQLKLDNVRDLSVYGIKGQAPISLIKK
jgi:hypothetical protein